MTSDAKGVTVEIAPSDWRARNMAYRWRGPHTFTWSKAHTVGWYVTVVVLTAATTPLLLLMAQVLLGAWGWGLLLEALVLVPITKTATRFSRHVTRSRTLTHHAATFFAEVSGKRPEQPRTIEYRLDSDSLEFS